MDGVVIRPGISSRERLLWLLWSCWLVTLDGRLSVDELNIRISATSLYVRACVSLFPCVCLCVCLGQYLPLANMKEIIKFCHEEGLLLFTDEVREEKVVSLRDSTGQVLIMWGARRNMFG